MRLLVDGSFVTDKSRPGDVDAVVFLPPDFDDRIARGDEAAAELYALWTERLAKDLFPAHDESEWRRWTKFFMRTRELDRRRKGVVEIIL